MSYDGLSERLSMTGYADGASVTTQYALDNGQVLTAEAGSGQESLSTTYLYGLGPIGELTDSWAYSLPDGANTPRQLADAGGEITLAASYTPWGDTLSVNGTGNFTFGYFGGVMDTATGLLYVGKGQYYDPSTGRFLNRNAKPDQTNPYMPWGGNPTGALLAPVFVLAMIYGRKKKRGKVDALIILAVLCLGVGMSLVACAPEPPATDLPLDLQATITSTETPTPVHTIDLTTATGTTVFHAEVPAAPSVTPSPSCTLTLLSYYKSELLSTYGVELLDSVPGGTGESVWTERLAYNAYRAVVDVANILGGPSRFREIYHTSDGNLVMKKVTTYTERVKVDCKGNHKPTDVCYEDVSHNYGGITNGEHDIQFASINYVAEDSVRNNIVHELGHAYDDGHGTPSGDMPDKFVRDRNLFLRPDDSVIWQIHKPETPSDSNPVETYADMFVAYVYDAWVQPNRFSPNPQTWMEGTIK